MTLEPSTLDILVQKTMTAIAVAPPPEGETATETTMRERFFELFVLSMANLYAKTPVASSMFDRNTIKVVSIGLDDNEAGRLSTRADDWIRLEGLVRVQEGQKNYTLNRVTLSVLSTITEHGTLGELFQRVAAAYADPGPTQELRVATRQLASYFMTRVSRS
jgi:hypothetical protein